MAQWGRSAEAGGGKSKSSGGQGSTLWSESIVAKGAGNETAVLASPDPVTAVASRIPGVPRTQQSEHPRTSAQEEHPVPAVEQWSHGPVV